MLVLVLVAKKVLGVRTAGVEKADEAGLSVLLVSRSLGLSLLGRESVFPKRLLAAAGEGNFVPNS